ncbi:MAG TPA: hypothetical protein DCF91_00010 [Porphyromonadaceae bacterium]|nr:hypothetical protein [Porphyromonadaceae bacterium]
MVVLIDFRASENGVFTICIVGGGWLGECLLLVYEVVVAKRMLDRDKNLAWFRKKACKVRKKSKFGS